MSAKASASFWTPERRYIFKVAGYTLPFILTSGIILTTRYFGYDNSAWREEIEAMKREDQAKRRAAAAAQTAGNAPDAESVSIRYAVVKREA